ncbi:unnamed protein product [Amoebophrya sp. A25]|nr:unnamed protein product [Amoebophrya sp. A25]|eukprot:GSA25T00020624001.1
MGGKGNKNGKGRHHGNTHGHGTNNQQNSNSQNSQNPVSRGPAMHQHEFVDQSDSIERDYLNSLFHKNQKGGGKHGGKNNQMKGGGGNGKGDGAGGKSKSGNTSGTDQDATPRETDYTSVDSQHGVAKGGDLDTLGEVYDHQGYHGFPNALAGGKTGGGKQSSAVTVDEIRGSELLARPTGMSQTSQSAALQAGSRFRQCFHP